MQIRRQHNATSGTVPYDSLTGTYTIDSVHSTLGFSVRHAMVTNVRGRFGTFEGLLSLDGTRPERSEAYVSVQTGSLDTGIKERDSHLIGPDFLNSSQYPLMAFRSTGVEQSSEGRFLLTGALRIKDAERPLDFDITFGGATRDGDGNDRVGFEGTATLHRSDWNLNWNKALEAGGVLISDKVQLLLDISAVRADASAA
ncbi:YceI family protein [Streptomyces zhihengii]|uniref:YceI family protein n=1 Tax=Streptomyces zhihengii TaxID=1818004 RepID=UPI0033B087E1